VSEPSEVFKPLNRSGGRLDEASAGTVELPARGVIEPLEEDPDVEVEVRWLGGGEA
jgi:hypothetical protein